MENSTSLVLVGGYGFIGRNILDCVTHAPDFAHLSPVIIDNLSNAVPGHETLGLPAHIGSYDTAKAVAFLEGLAPVQGGRVFVFLAGETRVAESKERPLDFIEANIASPARFVMQAVRPGDHFVLVSTAGALFDGSFEVSVDSPYCPKSLYGATKAAEEMILEKLVTLRGGTFSVTRLTNVYGKFSDNKKSAIHAFTRAAIADETVCVNGDGQQSRDFVYAGDVSYGIATLARKLAAGEETPMVTMLGAGQSASLMDVVEAIQKVTGNTLKYKKIEAKDLLATEPRAVQAKSSDMQVLLRGHITSLTEGIRQTHAYYVP